MSESKHTPGPWQLDKHGVVVLCQNKTAWRSYLPPITTFGSRDEDAFRAESNANARLIAAAPDLLAALEDLVPADMMEHPADFGPEWHQAYQAIAKATRHERRLVGI